MVGIGLVTKVFLMVNVFFATNARIVFGFVCLAL